MASSQISSLSLKKKHSIIGGRIFTRSFVLERVHLESDDVDTMELIISRIRQQGLYHLGSLHSELYDERIIEKFYLDASIKFISLKRGGDMSDITAKFRGVEIRLDLELLKNIYRLPYDGLKMEELETFESQERLTAYLGLFIGDGFGQEHPSVLPQENIYLHDFCCPMIENRTGAFEMCINMHFQMMVAIMSGERVNWCQIILKRLQEEDDKPDTQTKSFSLILNHILTKCDVPQSIGVKKI
ncbi:hypothetical protein OROMI_001219 [Orobanche minor]